MKYQCYLIRINFEKPYIKVGKTTNWANRKKNYLQNIPEKFLEELKFWDFESKEEMDIAEKNLIKMIDVDFKNEYSSDVAIIDVLMNIGNDILLNDFYTETDCYPDVHESLINYIQSEFSWRKNLLIIDILGKNKLLVTDNYCTILVANAREQNEVEHYIHSIRNFLKKQLNCDIKIRIGLPNIAKTSGIRIKVKRQCKMAATDSDGLAYNVVTVTMNGTSYRTTLEDFYNLRDTLMPHVLPIGFLDIDDKECWVYELPSLTFTTL
jgi:hypothetical protein